VRWCRRDRSCPVTWFLHGYTHLDEPARAGDATLSIKQRLKHRILTGSEGEFHRLGSEHMDDRIRRGREIFTRCLPDTPLEGFIAPAWLFHAGLFSILKAQGLSFTEDHEAIYHAASNQRWRAPVISWATRTRLRQYGAMAFNAARIRRRRESPLLRIALHPFDMDHPRTVGSIEGILEKALRDGNTARYRDLM
jgi:predicted deacetylase